MKSIRARAVLLAVLATLPGVVFSRPALAQGFPPISDEERALKSVPNEPNAAAVILFKRSEFELMGYGTTNRVSSRLVVQERRKILTEAGKEGAEVGSVAPLGPSTQPFVQPAEKRRTPVMFLFADRDETELRLRWPEGWKVETKPAAVNLQNKAGALAVTVEVDETSRSLVYRRKLDIAKRELTTTFQYDDVRTLYGKAEKSDAEPLALVRR